MPQTRAASRAAAVAHVADGRVIDTIVIHCSATPSGKRIGGGLGDRKRTPAMVIDGWHGARGFQRSAEACRCFNSSLKYIGYHYVIDIDGRIETGRSLQEAGAHARGHNATSVGICLVGGIEPVARYSAEQWRSLAALVTTLRAQRPDIRVVGHRDLSPDRDGDGQVEPHEWLKTCPGFDVARWLDGMAPAAENLLPPVRA